MSEIVETAQRLREVRQAYRHFLTLSAMEMLTADPMDRLVKDLDGLPSTSGKPDRLGAFFARDGWAGE